MADQTGKYKPFYAIPEPGDAKQAQLAALQLLSMGWPVIPLEGKAPKAPGWQDAPDRLAFLREHLRADGNLGIVCGIKTDFSFDAGQMAMVGLDFDFTDQQASDAAKELFPGAALRIGAAPKFLLAVRVGWLDALSTDYAWEKDGVTIKFQVLGRSDAAGPKQFATWGMHPDTKAPYRNLPDFSGRTIFDMQPGQLPFVHIASLYQQLDAALRALGWRMDFKVEHEPGEGEFAGEVTPEMIASAKSLFRRGVEELRNRPAGTNRGDDTHKLGLAIGMHIKMGLLSMDECVAELQAAMPDNVNAWSREFQRGVHASRGERLKAEQARKEAKENVDWAAAAAEQGVDWEAIKAGAQDKAEGFKAEDRDAAKDIYRAPLIAAVCDLLYDAIREREAETRAAGENVAWGFMASQLAAGMATADELVKEWTIRAARLTGINAARYAPDAQAAKDRIDSLKASEASWALHAAELMAAGVLAHESIRTSQYSHKAEQPKASESWAERIIKSAPASWERDGVDIRHEKSSNLAHFLAVKLRIWPMYDEFQQRIVFRRVTPGDYVTDKELESWNDRTGAAVAGIYTKATDGSKPWGRDHYAPKKADVETWLRDFASAHRFNSVLDKLDAWEAWDGKERLCDWLPRYLGYTHADAAHERVALAGEHFMRGFVARAWQPGVKFDALLILIGLQGAAKTTMFKSLCECIAKGSYAADVNLKFDKSAGHNRVAQAMTAVLLGELAELRNMRGHDSEELKGLLSAAGDRGRDINGGDTFGTLRQFALVGTVNPIIPGKSGGEITVELSELPPWLRPAHIRQLLDGADVGFLQDPTGNRRMMPVMVLCDEIDRCALAVEAPQLIAEAQHQLKGLGLKQAGADFEVVMCERLRVLLGSVETQYMATSDMMQRLTDELGGMIDDTLTLSAGFVNGLPPDCIITFKDMREHMGLKSAQERSQLQTAFDRMGFRHTNGAHNKIWYVRGDKTKAQHVTAVREHGRITRWVLGKMFGEVGRAPGE